MYEEFVFTTYFHLCLVLCSSDCGLIYFIFLNFPEEKINAIWRKNSKEIYIKLAHAEINSNNLSWFCVIFLNGFAIGIRFFHFRKKKEEGNNITTTTNCTTKSYWGKCLLCFSVLPFISYFCQWKALHPHYILSTSLL